MLTRHIQSRSAFTAIGVLRVCIYAGDVLTLPLSGGQELRWRVGEQHTRQFNLIRRVMFKLESTTSTGEVLLHWMEVSEILQMVEQGHLIHSRPHKKKEPHDIH